MKYTLNYIWQSALTYVSIKPITLPNIFITHREDGVVAVGDGRPGVGGELRDPGDVDVDGAVVALGGGVLAEDDAQARGGLALRAVGGGEDVAVGDEAAPAEGRGRRAREQPRLPRVLVLLRLHAAHDASSPVRDAALAARY